MNFLAILRLLTPLLGVIIQAAVPSLHPAAIPHVIAAIGNVENLPGKSGADKLSAAVAIAQDSVAVAAAQGVPIPSNVIDDIPAAVQIGVDVVNALHKHPIVTGVPDQSGAD